MSKSDAERAGAAVVLRRAAPVATVLINRPQANNAIDRHVRAGLLRAAGEIAADRSIRVVVLASTSGDSFSSGLDISEIAVLSPQEADALAREARQVYEAFAALEVPVVAAIRGACIGAGLELALHCDIRFARIDARFALPGVGVGLVPGGGALARLSRIVGAGPARAFALTGAAISAERAFMLGLVANVAQADEFDDVLGGLVGHLASLSPVAMRELKMLLAAAENGEIGAAADLGPAALARCFAEGDAGERLRTLFRGLDPEATLH